jgi:hypothetical protein
MGLGQSALSVNKPDDSKCREPTHIAIVVDQRTPSTGKVVFFQDCDFESGLC